MWKPLIACQHPAKFVGHSYCGSRDVFSLLSDLARPHDERVVWLNGYEPLKVSPQPVTFGGSTMVLVCHVILQDQVKKGSSNFVGGGHSR